MSRKRKKSKKKRGSRTHGYGAARKHRGAGSRGGRGRAGRGKKAKHKKLTALKEEKGKGQEKGFSRPQQKQKSATTMNLMDIDQQLEELVEKGYAEKEGDRYLFDAKQAGVDKILGKGQLKHNVDIKADSFSSKAKDKLAEAGCKAITDESESA